MEHQPIAQIKKLLGAYHDIPYLIKQRRMLIEEIYLQTPSIIKSPSLNGMPAAPHSGHSDPTYMASLAWSEWGEDGARKAVKEHREAIQRLQEKRNWMCAALSTLDRTDRLILEMAYMGPENPEKRKSWTRRPPWKEIVSLVDYSRSQTMDRANKALKKLSDMSSQQVMDVFTV